MKTGRQTSGACGDGWRAVRRACVAAALLVTATAAGACSYDEGWGGCTPGETCGTQPHYEGVHRPSTNLFDASAVAWDLDAYVEQHCHEICNVDAGACELVDRGNGDWGNVKCPDTRPRVCPC